MIEEVVLVSGTQFEEDFDMEDVADVHHPPFFDDDEDDGISDEKVVEKDCLMERPDESIQDKEPEPLKCLVQIKDQQLKTALESPNITTRKRNKVADFFSDSSESSLEKLVDIQKTEKVEISDEELSEELSEYEPAKEDVSSVKLIIGKSPLPSKLSAKLDDVASNSDSDHQLVLKFKNRKVIHTSSSSDSENLMQISRKKPILDTIIDESESQQESSDSDDTSKSCVDSSDSEVLLLNHLNTIKRPDRKSISRQNSNVSPNRSNKLEVSNPANEISRKSIEMPKALVRSRESSIEAPKRHTLLFSETAFEPRSQKIEPEKRNPSFGNKQGAMKKANIVDSDSDDVKIAHKSLTEPYKRFSGKLGDLKESVVSSDSEDLKPISRHKSLDSQSNKRKISWPNQEVDLKKKRVVSVEKRSSNVRYFGGVEESIGDVEKETKGEPEKRSNGLWPVRYSIPTLDEALEAYIENAVADLPEYILF